jgi:hypothetical protein
MIRREGEFDLKRVARKTHILPTSGTLMGDCACSRPERLCVSKSALNNLHLIVSSSKLIPGINFKPCRGTCNNGI